MGNNQKLSVFLSLLLRHKPEEVELIMDKHGWVSVNQLITNINKQGKYYINFEMLEDIVNSDNKGRYRFNDNKTKIKACQGHSIDWVEPELSIERPPDYIYHGTNTDAMRLIEKSGFISKMKRHAVHTQADESKAWQSAERWHRTAVVLKINAAQMYKDGFVFGRSDNDVWCVESIPTKYIEERIFVKSF